MNLSIVIMVLPILFLSCNDRFMYGLSNTIFNDDWQCSDNEFLDGDDCISNNCDCPNGTYWDGSSCYECDYCCNLDDDSGCSAPYDCWGSCNGCSDYY